MKILYDHQAFSRQKYGGISRYFYELIKGLSDVSDVQPKTSLLISDNYYISNTEYIKYINFLQSIDFRGKHTLMMQANKINSIYQVNKKDFDIFHPTYYDPYFLKHIGNKAFVLTVYDMILEKFSEFFPKDNRLSQNKRMVVDKAFKIIAISESTKKDLIECFDVEPSKIKVVYLGNSMRLSVNSTLDFFIPEKYILFVGSRVGYKNFKRFIRVTTAHLKEDPDLFIVCVGGRKFKVEELSFFKKLNIQDRIFHYNLDDESLSQFYRNAMMFVFPSLYEGFGIPILEAFACKCPLVCSNTSSLPEIAYNGAELFDPYSEESMHRAIKNVLDDSCYRKQLINNGIQRLNHFSWSETVANTKKVYESVLR